MASVAKLQMFQTQPFLILNPRLWAVMKTHRNLDSPIKHIHDKHISWFSPGADPQMCPKDISLSSFILLLAFLWRIKQRENSLHWTAPSGSRNSSYAINNEDEELLCQNTGVHHCSSTCVLLARLYLQRADYFHFTLVLKSFNKQNVNLHPLLRSSQQFFFLFVPSAPWSTFSPFFSLSLSAVLPLSSLLDSLETPREQAMRDHLPETFLLSGVPGLSSSASVNTSPPIPPVWGRTAKKGRRWNLAKTFLTNSTDQWLLKHSFKNNTIHPPPCIASPSQPFPTSTSSLLRPKSFLAPGELSK